MVKHRPSIHPSIHPSLHPVTNLSTYQSPGKQVLDLTGYNQRFISDTREIPIARAMYERKTVRLNAWDPATQVRISPKDSSRVGKALSGDCKVMVSSPAHPRRTCVLSFRATPPPWSAYPSDRPLADPHRPSVSSRKN